MGARSNNPLDFSGKHYWMTDHFSVPAEGLCLNIAPSPNADHWCIREAGHPGRHHHVMQPDIRSHSWRATPSVTQDKGGEL
jgi:hypothetical protein